MKKATLLLIGIFSSLFIIGCSAQEAIHTELDAASDDAQVVIRGRTGDDTYQVPRIDPVTQALILISYGHHQLHAGNMFTVFEVNDLGNGANRTLLIVTPDTTRWAHLVWEFEHELEATIDFYKDSIYIAPGTIVPSFNRNGNSTNVATTLVYHSPTLLDAGMLIATIQQGDGKKAGGSDRVANEFILEQNTAYLIRITNNTASNNLASMKLNWYEHISRSP